jgi:ADP-ribose pyrophosphatase YjhB (NUDIX family)
MPFLTVCVVVFEDSKVLLTKRHDFHIWCLPSGGVEDGETVVDAAVRETQEETGIEVRITRLVGIYSRPTDTPSGHAVVFAAVPVGGKICTQPGETIDVRYFDPTELPEALSFGHRRRILDAFQGVAGAVVMQRSVQDTIRKTNRQERYDLRDQSGLTPDQFYLAYFQPDQIHEERLI